MRIAIDVRAGGTSGGVQQWIVGLAHALSGLESDAEEYLFVIRHGNQEWLEPHVSGQCRLLIRPPAFRPRVSRWFGSARERIAIAAPLVRDVWRRYRPEKNGLEISDGFVERLGADLVHFPQQLAYLTAIPTVYQPWDLQHIHLPAFFTDKEYSWREASYRTHCEEASLIITATQWIKRDVAEQYLIPPERIAVVNVPPPTEAYPEPTPSEVLAIAARLMLPDRFIFYPAQTWPHKNHARLLEALALLRAEGVTVPLVCSGYLNERHPELHLQAERLGIAANVHFLGLVNSKEVLALYDRAWALVFPSLYEGWGIPILEAFKHDLPVACSNVTSLPELVGDAALLFDPNDPADIAAAIRKLWTDDSFANELRRRGRSVVARYDWHRTAMLMRANYRRAAGRQLDDEDLELVTSIPSV